jgi:sugar lactone lactonase YvrE
MLRTFARTAALSALVLAVLAPAAGAKQLPQTIALPSGWQPEGIASGHGSTLYVGSIPTGAIWAGDARTGTGAVRVPAHEGRSAIGIKVDRRNQIFVSGGATGDAYVYDARTGADVASYQLAPEGANTFVNDVVLTRRGAFFTDSRIQQMYRVRNGKVRTIPLTGDIVYQEGNNANGIVGDQHGRNLIVVQSNTGKLFRVDARSGRTREIDLGGATVVNGDGLLLKGRTLFVVQNRDNKIAVVKLDRRWRNGRVKAELTDPDFDVPTTIAFTLGRLWAVNARFGAAPGGPDLENDIVQVGKGR